MATAPDARRAWTVSRSAADADAGADRAKDGDLVRTVHDVRVWLANHGFGVYVDVFTANEINGAVLKTLTSEELRDDLGVVNLRHRRDLIDAIERLIADSEPVVMDPLPEHGRILDHLSNVRSFHSWQRVGVQLLGFAIVTLRLAPNFRGTAVISAASFYFAIVGVLALLYGIFRYRTVNRMIEQSGAYKSQYSPDRAGVLSIFILVLIASIVTLTIIVMRGFG